MKIPFDALTLSAIGCEIEPMLGGKCQGVWQSDEHTVVLELYSRGVVRHLLLSCHPVHFRVHFSTRRESAPSQPPVFCATLRARLKGSTLESIKMKTGDRVLVLDFGGHRLIAELMGKHSNLILIDEHAKVVAAAMWVGATKSKRPILPNTEYFWPPVLKEGKDINDFSSFERIGTLVHSKLRGERPLILNPGFAAGVGAYPIDLSSEFPTWVPRESLSIALENHFNVAIPQALADSLRHGLVAQLERVILARETSLAALYEARDAGGKAALWQRYGELLLAFASHMAAGPAQFETQDYDGTPLTIRLNTEESAKENALRYFDKAKRAKGRMGLVTDQIARLEADKERVEALLFSVLEAKTIHALETLKEQASKCKWLHQQTVSHQGVAERPYEGHRIKELMGPHGSVILYGENSESNDYLTLRVAKGNDWWLHVRGHTSAHVIIRTGGKPESVSREAMLFAAKVAVQHSPQKHAGFVAVDYTLKKYVRKPRGAAKGTALYTHEKTLHVEGD